MYKNGKKPNFKIVNRYYKEYVDANNRQFNTIYKPANTLRKSKERNVLLEQKKLEIKETFHIHFCCCTVFVHISTSCLVHHHAQGSYRTDT